ncbi:MAG: arsenate reductase ArsC [Thermoproteota archaeon]|nr:arsenate reductase ArsC [Thermoproteota archaeon]
MKLFKHESKKSVLFVCVQNAGRSQMAEGFFKKYAPKEYEAISAGTMPVSEINPLAVEVMREVDIDISGQKSKEITEDMIRNSSKIVNMGCMDKVSCPTLFLQNLLDWNIEDPRDKQIEKVREIRDEIEQRVKKLVTDIKNYQ